MSELTCKHGIFKEELKNRFLCLVEVDGEDILCYIPSSCRLSNFIDLTGKEVLLLPIASSRARTKYSVYAFHENNNFILLNMSKANETIEKNIRSRRFFVLGKRTNIKKEYRIENYKSDLYIEDTKTVVEIKSILSFSKDNTALFPTVHSQRAIDQLRKLRDLLDKGYNVCYIFASLNPKIKQVTINKAIIEYRKEFNLCIERGMIVKGVSLKLMETTPTICSNLVVIT